MLGTARQRRSGGPAPARRWRGSAPTWTGRSPRPATGLAAPMRYGQASIPKGWRPGRAAGRADASAEPPRRLHGAARAPRAPPPPARRLRLEWRSVLVGQESGMVWFFRIEQSGPPDGGPARATPPGPCPRPSHVRPQSRQAPAFQTPAFLLSYKGRCVFTQRPFARIAQSPRLVWRPPAS